MSKYFDDLKAVRIMEKDISIIVQKLEALEKSGLAQSEIGKIVDALKTNAKFRTAFIENPKVVTAIQKEGKLGRTPYVW